MNTNRGFELETTSSDILIQMLTDEEDGEEATETFFKSEFLASAVDALFSARRKAGLTQAQVADRLHTKQASIARLEADTTGSITLRRYVEVALACGMVPLDITLVPISSARQYVIENPEKPITADAYALWHMPKNLQPYSAGMNFNEQNDDYLNFTASTLKNTVSDTEQDAEALFLQSSQNWFNKGKITPLTLSQSMPLATSVGQTASGILKEKVAV